MPRCFKATIIATLKNNANCSKELITVFTSLEYYLFLVLLTFIISYLCERKLIVGFIK